MRSARSKTVTAWPARASCWAAARPAGPEPTTATVLPVRVAGGSGTTQPSSQARSMIATSICLIVTGSSLIPSTHEASHGAGQRRAGELGEVVGRVQAVDGRAPLVAVDEVVPVGDQVAERAALVAERDAAVHAARALLAQLVARATGDRPRSQSWTRSVDRAVRLLVPLELHEAGGLTHDGSRPLCALAITASSADVPVSCAFLIAASTRL